MAGKLDYRWHLRQIMADRGLFSTSGRPRCASCPDHDGRDPPGHHRRDRHARPQRRPRHRPRGSTCTAPPSWHSCPTCQAADAPRPGRCARCLLDRRLTELLTGPTGDLHPDLRPLHQALVTTARPSGALHWPARDTVAALLSTPAADRQPLTHQLLDNLPASPTLSHLRTVLVASGILPPPDEHMARLEHLLHDLLAARPDPDQRQLQHRYAVWHLLRRLRHRNQGQDTTTQQLAVVRVHIRSALALLDWLTAQHLTLATCRQADLNRWLADEHTSYRVEAGHFVRWALTSPPRSSPAPSASTSTSRSPGNASPAATGPPTPPMLPTAGAPDTRTIRKTDHQ